MAAVLGSISCRKNDFLKLVQACILGSTGDFMILSVGRISRAPGGKYHLEL